MVMCGMTFSAVAVTAKPVAGKASAHAKSTPGLEAAKAISLITGVAISPLLGVGAVGAWEYFSTPPELRAKLDWYAHPAFWIPALLLVLMVGAKDLFGTAVPSALKKPFDVAEVIENKISGLVAAGAFIPLIVTIFPHTVAGDAQAGWGTGVGGLPFAMIDGASILNTLLVPFALLAFFLVWMVSHAINILIVISPFTTVDTALKSARLFLLSLVTVTAFANPYFGAAFSLAIIVCAYFLAGWSFRLMVFGHIYAWDFFTMRRLRFEPEADAGWMFAAQEINQAPIRTYGKLRRNEAGQLCFDYRPWLVLPKCTLVLTPATYAVGRGLFFPEIMRVEAERTNTLFTMPPRYRTHEEAVARVYGFGEVRDVGLLKGFKTTWTLVKNLFRSNPKPIGEVSTAPLALN